MWARRSTLESGAQRELDGGFSSVGGKRHSGKGKLIPPSVELRSPEYTAVWKREGGGGEEEEGRVGRGREKMKTQRILVLFTAEAHSLLSLSGLTFPKL